MDKILSRENIVALGFGSFTLYVIYDLFLRPSPPPMERKFTEDTLALYSGRADRLCYVAVGEQVFDVSKFKREFLAQNFGGRPIPESATALAEVANGCIKVGTLLVKKPFTKAELSKFIGDKDHPPYICAKGRIFEVARSFYGPNGPYGCFAGRDASRALALHSTEQEDIDNTDLSDLSAEELSELDGWIQTFESKYMEVGYLVGE